MIGRPRLYLMNEWMAKLWMCVRRIVKNSTRTLSNIIIVNEFPCLIKNTREGEFLTANLIYSLKEEKENWTK